MIYAGDQQVRRVFLDVPHSANPKPSWYGESVGHYEGDTLVVDTIGETTKTFIDQFRTPHGPKLHVIERIRLVEGGDVLETELTIEDPDALLKPLHLVHQQRKVRDPMTESVVQRIGRRSFCARCRTDTGRQHTRFLSEDTMRKLFGLLTVMLVPVAGYAAENGLKWAYPVEPPPGAERGRRTAVEAGQPGHDRHDIHRASADAGCGLQG